LRISGAIAARVPSLAIPDLRSVVGPDELVRCPAVQLFVEPAQALESDFRLVPRSTRATAAICARLEGLPVAIKLAAAWVRVLGVDQIVERTSTTGCEPAVRQIAMQKPAIYR
jgi:predicted ATPase